MAKITLDVFKFSELSESVQNSLIEEKRNFYFDCMFYDDLYTWIMDELCPMKNTAVSIDSLDDVSWDLSNDRYDHFTFRNPKLDINKLLVDSKAIDLINEASDNSFTACIMHGDKDAFINNLDISWQMNSNTPFNDSGEIIVELLNDNDGMYDNDAIESLLEDLADKMTEYMHNLQSKMYSWLIDNVDSMTSDENLREWIEDDDKFYLADGSQSFDEDEISK